MKKLLSIIGPLLLATHVAAAAESQIEVSLPALSHNNAKGIPKKLFVSVNGKIRAVRPGTRETLTVASNDHVFTPFQVNRDRFWVLPRKNSHHRVFLHRHYGIQVRNETANGKKTRIRFVSHGHKDWRVRGFRYPKHHKNFTIHASEKSAPYEPVQSLMNEAGNFSLLFSNPRRISPEGGIYQEHEFIALVGGGLHTIWLDDNGVKKITWDGPVAK